MKVLLDTNILIYREDDRIVPKNLQRLHRTINSQGHEIVVHPLSKKEIQRDSNEERRKKAESKISTYPVLEYPPYPQHADDQFREYISPASNPNDRVDNALLYAVYSALLKMDDSDES